MHHSQVGILIAIWNDLLSNHLCIICLVLFRIILQTLRLPGRPQEKTMISDRIKKLIQQAEMNKAAEEFWKEVEREAAKHEVTCEYYLAEFY